MQPAGALSRPAGALSGPAEALSQPPGALRRRTGDPGRGARGGHTDPVHPLAPLEIRAVRDDEWDVVARLWQAFRSDLALVVQGLPYSDGRYQAGPLSAFPSPDAAGLLALRPHPNTGEAAPVGFALVEGLRGPERTVTGFWVAPVARRGGVGRRLALAALALAPSPWRIGFQHENPGAGVFWRRTADEAFGPAGWSEERLPVPSRPDAPDDHLIRTR